MKNEKGITLTSLVIMIIVLIILASIATYSGVSTIRYTKYNKAKAEMEIMQANVNEWYDEYNKIEDEEKKIDYINEHGLPISDESCNQGELDRTLSENQITDVTNYRFLSVEYVKNILGIDNSYEFLINIPKREVLLFNGIKYEGKIYYTIEDFGGKNIEKVEINELSFQLKQGVNSDVIINDLKLIDEKEKEIDISKFYIEYKIKNSENNWIRVKEKELNKYKNNDKIFYKFPINNYGTYLIKISTIDKKISNQEEIEIHFRGNLPKLSDGMIPIKYNEASNKWIITDQTDIDWFDYTNRKWANIMLCDGKYNTSSEVGTEINANELGSMFVWIPRYAYRINTNYHSNITGDIDIKFLIDKGNKTEDNEIISNYSSETTEGYTKFPNGYVVHPSFTNKENEGGWDTQLTGFWVAKFEAGYPMPDTEDNIISKTADNMYYPVFKGQRYPYNCYSIQMLYLMCESMSSSGNPYSINSNSNSHMIKNSEWGAVAYLTKSSYGNVNEIYSNNIYFNSDKRNINNKYAYSLTGYSSDIFIREKNDVSANKIEEVMTGNSYTSYIWYSSNGVNASTTGNQTGIYDISGCCWEYTAGVIPSGHTIINDNGGNIFSSLNSSNKKITLYPIKNSTSLETDISRDYSLYGVMYGDGIWETSLKIGGSYSWNDDRTDADNHTDEPFFLRGGDCIYNTNGWSGIFSFTDFSGAESYDCSTRAVLTVL